MKPIAIVALYNELRMADKKHILRRFYNDSSCDKLYNNSSGRRFYDDSSCSKFYNGSSCRRFYDDFSYNEFCNDSSGKIMGWPDDPILRKFHDDTILRRCHEESILKFDEYKSFKDLMMLLPKDFLTNTSKSNAAPGDAAARTTVTAPAAAAAA